MGVIATSQITIVDLNDQVSLSSYITCNTPKLQLLTNTGTYIPSYITSPVLFSAELYKIGVHGSSVIESNEVKKVDWYYKTTTDEDWVKVLPTNTDFELITKSGKTVELKLLNNIMTQDSSGISIESRISYKEYWMPEEHIQKTSIDLGLSIQGDDGESGADAYTVSLSNEAHTVICNSNGTPDIGEVGPTSRAISDIEVYKGITGLTSVAHDATPANNQFNYKIINTSGCLAQRTDNDTFYISELSNTNSKISIDGKIDNTGTLQNANLDNGGFVEVEINIENKQRIKKRMTISKVLHGVDGDNGLDGSDGESAKYITVSSNAQVFKLKKGETNYNPASIVLNAETFNFTHKKVLWKASINTSDSNVFLPASGTNNTMSYTVFPNAVEFNTVTSVTYRCYVDDIYTDEISISKLEDGEDTYNALLTNETHTIACSFDGTPKASELEKAVTKVIAYKGINELIKSSTPAKDKFSLAIGSVIPVNGAKAIIENQDTIKITEITNNSIIEVLINCDNKTTIKKIFTVNKTLDGTSGKDAYNIVLTNEHHSIPTDSEGNNGNYLGCETSINLYRASQLIDTDVIYTHTTSTGITGTLTNNKFVVSNMAVDSGYVDLTAEYNKMTFTKKFTISKNKQGLVGNDAINYWLTCDSNSITKTEEGVLSPNSVTFVSKSKLGNNNIQNYHGRYKIYVSTDGTTYPTTPSYSSSSNESSKAFSVPVNAQKVKCELYLTDATTLIDIITVNVIKDGINAKTITVSGEQTFKYQNNFAGVPTPSQIALTATKQNISQDGKWQYYNGTDWTDYEKDNTVVTELSLTVLHNEALFNTDTVRSMRVRYTYGSISDEMTIAKLSDGTDAYTVVLTNENHTCVSDSEGTVTSEELSKAKSEIQVFKGTSNAPFTVSINALETIGCTAAWESNNIVIKTLTEDSAKVSVNITVDNKQIIKKVMTISKARKGTSGSNGLNALALDIVGERTFIYDANGNLNKNSITLSVLAKNFTASSSNIKWQVINANNTVTDELGTSINKDITPTTPGWINNTIKIKATYTGNSSVYDIFTINKLYDGKHSLVGYIWGSGPNGTIISNNVQPDGTILVPSLEVSAILLWGSNEITSDENASYKWVSVNPDGTETVLRDNTSGDRQGYKINIGEEQIPNRLSVKCYMSYGGQILKDLIVLEDKSDPYQSSVFSTLGSTFKNATSDTHTYLIARLHRDGKEYDIIDLYDELPSTSGIAESTIIYNKKDDKYYKLTSGRWTSLTSGETDIVPDKSNGHSRYSYVWNRWNELGETDGTTFKQGKICKVLSSNVQQTANFVVTIQD